MATREPGVIAGVEIALLVLDEVIGPDGYGQAPRDDGARLEAERRGSDRGAPTQVC
jgi:nicotinate-nucleotide pyrophosphorylase (carboxylating)